MFTGIIEEVGTIVSIQRSGSQSNPSNLTIKCELITQDLSIGDSVSCNGICLTVVSIKGQCFSVDVMNETLARTSLGLLKAGSHMNLERAMPASGRFGGHIVSGHIDGIGTVQHIRKDGIAIWYTIQTDSKIMHYIVEKGSIAIDGISLTVAKLHRDTFEVSIIPHTAQKTILSEKRTGSIVNLENDLVGKYVEKMTASSKDTLKNYFI